MIDSCLIQVKLKYFMHIQEEQKCTSDDKDVKILIEGYAIVEKRIKYLHRQK